jgi:hypothetical protein
MNAQVGRDSICEPNIGRYSRHDDRNDNGSRLVDFALAHNLVGETMFIHKKIHNRPWRTPGGNAINQIDHRLIDARHRSNILDVRAFRGANVDSDHYMIGPKIQARIARSKLEKGMRMEKFNVDLLKNGINAQYAEQVIGLLGQSSIGITDTSNVNDDWKFLRMCIISAADEVIGKTPQEERKSWFDEEYQEITRKKTEIYRQIQQR